jgi:hypothetical protein
MSSRLEQFMRDHRDEFDTDEPGAQVWEKLNKELIPPAQEAKVVSIKKSFGMTALRWSAAAAILLLAGLGVYHLVNPKTPTGPVDVVQTPAGKETTPKEEDLLKDINPTYAKEVYHFTQLIELKQSELKQIEKDNPDLYKQFTTDITKLDSSYNSLKKELPTNPNREQLLEAMIQNLRLQTELLNQQLQIIQQIKKAKQADHESNSKSV